MAKQVELYKNRPEMQLLHRSGEFKHDEQLGLHKSQLLVVEFTKVAAGQIETQVDW